jgi:ribosome-associated protein
MKFTPEQKSLFLKEFKFSASRSGGAGGQHVNKVNTKVELRFSLTLTSLLSEAQKRNLALKLASRINTENEIILVSSVERSQWRNKEIVVDKFFALLENALTPQKKRIKTNLSKASKLKRIEGKKMLAQKKKMRKKPEL